MTYEAFGYRANPFDTTALKCDENGERLLVGREAEIAGLVRRITTTTKIPTVEGANGIGKTSIINVANFKISRNSYDDSSLPLFIPCRCIFQLHSETNIDEFEESFYIEIAQTLVENSEFLRPPPGHTSAPRLGDLKEYISEGKSRSYSASALGFGGGTAKTNHETYAFRRVGFRKKVTDLLEQMFPSGGVLCVIDNLELMKSSEAARELVEVLRDRIFSLKGVRWVLCGASGVVRGVASSPRMVGWMHNPINVQNVDHEKAGDLYDARLSICAGGETKQLPISRSEFIELFEIMNGNTRFVLNEADDYCNYVFDCEFENNDPESIDDWLVNDMDLLYADIFLEASPDDHYLFESACQLEIFKASDRFEMGVSEQSKFLEKIASLAKNGLITVSLDLEDIDQKVYELTAKAYKLQYFIASQD